MRLVLVALVLVLAAGCGGGDGEKPAANSTLPAMVSVETDACREASTEVLNLSETMKADGRAGDLSYNTFKPRYDSIQVAARAVKVHCSVAVQKQLNMAIYKFSLVNFALLNCDTVADCSRPEILDPLAEAWVHVELAHDNAEAKKPA